MKFFVVFYLIFGLATPGLIKEVATNGIPSAWSPQAQWYEVAAAVALGALLLFYPAASVYALIQAKRKGEPPPEQAIKGVVITTLSYATGIGVAFWYGI